MTIGGAISELNNLLKADDIPIYYKPSIKKVIETIEQEPFINKPCVSQGICHEDKVKVLEDIKAEIKRMADNEWNQQVGSSKGLEEAIEVVEKYMD